MAISAAVLLGAAPLCLAQNNWTWHMPVSIYQNLDFGKRAAIDRGRAAYEKAAEATRRNVAVPEQIPLYRAAAAEWEKFRVNFELDMDVSDAVNAYVLFMRAYSLQGARDRNTAIKLYQELIDFYAGETWITPAALFMIGQNKQSNGEIRPAKRFYEELVSSEAMRKHSLASRAYKNLGSFAWTDKKYAEAIDYWRKGSAEEYKNIARADYDEQRNLLRASIGVTCRWNELTDFIFEGLDEKNIKGRINAVIACEDNFRNWGTRNWWNDWYFNPKFEKDADRKAEWTKHNQGFAKWHEGFKTLFAQDGREWQFAMRSFAFRREYSLPEAKKLIPEISGILKASPDNTKTARVREFGFALCDVKMYEEARTLLPLINGKVDQLWYTYEVDSREGKWDACVLTLEALMANADPEVVLKAKKTLAWVYKDRLRDYEKAIKLYLDISQPPGTLWDLYDCYRRSGQKKQAYATLGEITFFPDHAARSIWRQAEDHLADGEKDLAIGLYRRLLSQPEWKKTWESSQAHQRLESMGIATGGAVIDVAR